MRADETTADETTQDETRRRAAIDPAIRDAMLQFLKNPKSQPLRKRSAEAVSADTLWWYWMECYRRSRRREALLKALKERGLNAERMEALTDLHEEVCTAPVLPVDTDGESWVTLKIDVRLPRKAILALVEDTLQSLDGRELRELKDHATRQVVEVILQRLRQAPPTPFARILLPKRIRKESLQARLKAWDLIKAGATFQDAACRMKKSESQVRDLFNLAYRDICGPPASKGRRKRLAETIDPRDHCTTCPTCKKATRFDEMCAAGRAYANANYRSQREVSNTRDIEGLAAALKFKSGKKPRSI